MQQVVKFRVTGRSSLLMNNPASMLAPKSAGPRAKVIPTPEQEAARAVYLTKSGQLYAPAQWFRASLIKGCVGKRMGKTSATTQVSAGVFTVPGCQECGLVHPKTNKPIKKYEINIARAVVMKAAIPRARPEIHEWACDLFLELDSDFVSIEAVEDLYNTAGRIAGVGDYRCNKGGEHGRYSVEVERDAKVPALAR